MSAPRPIVTAYNDEGYQCGCVFMQDGLYEARTADATLFVRTLEVAKNWLTEKGAVRLEENEE